VKGLLHRLAARASGATVSVHSDARLPFGGTELGRSAEVSEAAGWPRAPTSLAEAQHGQNSISLGPQADRTRRDPQLPHADGSIPRAGPESLLPAVSAIAQTGELETSLPMRLVSAAPVGTETVAAFELESGPLPTRGQSDVHGDSPSGHAARVSDEPTLLMPTATRAPGNAQRHVAPTTARQAAMAQGAASESATEIHIHIGRIDVTAVHESAPPRRAPPKSPPPMSLDNYLAKRGRT
jgi:hypothetical protein